jgi:hypothetical protein
LASEAIPRPYFLKVIKMIAIMDIDEPRPRGTIMGEWNGLLPRAEAEHFVQCPLCGGYVDLRDRVWCEEHQGPLPHPACDGPN